MTIATLPSLDRTSATFKTDVDTFFATQLPTFSTDINALAADVTSKQGIASAAADTATTQAGIATTGANTATTQAGIATTKAGEANASAIAAALSETNAAILFDQFDDKYLGAKASDPALDNDGNPLTAGATYINTTTNFVRFYTGSAWVNGISGVAGVSSVNGQTGDVTVVATVNGATGAVTVAGLGSNTFTGAQNYSDNQNTRAMLKDCGYTVFDKGNISNATVTFDYTAGSVQTYTATGSTVTWAFSNWPPAGNLGELLIIGTNLGAYTHSISGLTWTLLDGTTTTSVATFLAQNGSRKTFQSPGIDKILVVTRDGGTTMYASLLGL